MKPIIILLAGFALLAQAPVPPVVPDRGDTPSAGDVTDSTYTALPVCESASEALKWIGTKWACVPVVSEIPVYAIHSATVIWSNKEFKEYCGTLTDCKIPDDVLVVPSADEQLDERIKYLEQTVQNQQLDIFTLQRDVRALQAKIEKEQ